MGTHNAEKGSSQLRVRKSDDLSHTTSTESSNHKENDNIDAVVSSVDYQGEGGKNIEDQPLIVTEGSSKQDKQLDAKVVYEFGGPAGVTAIMIFFPILMLYFFLCLHQHSGALVFPSATFWAEGLPSLMPTMYAAEIYIFFNIFQALTAVTMPGIIVEGLPVPSLGGRRLKYLCNGVSTWYLDLAVLFVIHNTGLWSLTNVIDNIGPITSVAILWGFFISLVTYMAAFATDTTHRMSGSFLYDYFMGAILNPRLGPWLDLKMWNEIRIPWKILFFVTLSAAVKEHETNTEAATLEGLPTSMDWMGVSVPIIRTSAPLVFMTLAHGLYVNACMKGEECIPTTWDIFYEKWGFMLIFWNFAGVPFSYCYSSLYLLDRSLQGEPIEHSKPYTVILFVILLGAYYIWDTANSQKNRFRMQERGTYVERHTFPQLPWGTLKDPAYIQTKHGNKLLTGGWWGVARKIHYTADLTMALLWGLVTGFDSLIPYFYFCFFLVVLVHRVGRDMARCSEKYGEDWKEYCRIVPYIFIPFVY